MYQILSVTSLRLHILIIKCQFIRGTLICWLDIRSVGDTSPMAGEGYGLGIGSTWAAVSGISTINK